MSTKTRATIEDLYKVDGKAELVNGEIVHMAPTGRRPGRAGGQIYASLRRMSGATAAVPPSRIMWGLRSICHTGNRSARMRHGTPAPIPACVFVPGAPVFAVEVRSEEDYGPAAEREMGDKRADYFACGTLVVWDVDLQSEDVMKSYKASDPENPVIFRRGEIADAEPAVPGWRMAVDELFG